MDASSGPNDPQRLILFSREAALDLAEIHTYTTREWGWDQAERYIEFITDEAQKAADDLSRGRPVADRPKKFLVTVKWPVARYTHRIIYEVFPEGIYVLRVLHGAMDLQRHIDQE